MTPVPLRPKTHTPDLLDAAIAKYGARHVAAMALIQAIQGLFLPRLRQTAVDDLPDRMKHDIGYREAPGRKHPPDILR